jgi:predicted ATPase
VIGRLIERSLIFVPEHETNLQRRYRLLETVRQYAHEKPLRTDGTSDASTRHAEYYLELAEQAEPRIKTSGSVLAPGADIHSRGRSCVRAEEIVRFGRMLVN